MLVLWPDVGSRQVVRRTGIGSERRGVDPEESPNPQQRVLSAVQRRRSQNHSAGSRLIKITLTPHSASHQLTAVVC